MWKTADHITSKFLKAVFHKFYLVHSWTLHYCVFLKLWTGIDTEILFSVLIHLMPLVSFYTFWKHQESSCFLTFSGGYRTRPVASNGLSKRILWKTKIKNHLKACQKSFFWKRLVCFLESCNLMNEKININTSNHEI